MDVDARRGRKLKNSAVNGVRDLVEMLAHRKEDSERRGEVETQEGAVGSWYKS